MKHVRKCNNARTKHNSSGMLPEATSKAKIASSMDATFSKYWQVAGWPGKHLLSSTEVLSSRNSGAKRVARSCWQLTLSAQSSAAAMKTDRAAIAAPAQIFMLTEALHLLSSTMQLRPSEPSDFATGDTEQLMTSN